MNKPPRGFFLRLHQRIAWGLRDLPAEDRRRHVAFLLSRQQADGGFVGRAGGSDLYYTSFAAQSLSLLAALDGGEPLRRCAAFVQGCRPKDIIELVQHLHAGLLLGTNRDAGDASVAKFLESYRSADGGYGKQVGAAEGSTYWSYLTALCYDAIGDRPPDRGRLRAFLRGRQCSDGGFSETGHASVGSTNATAAGVALAAMIGLSALPMIPPALRFLAGMQSPMGGFLAGGCVPVPDLLSTFTVVVALTEAKAVGRIDLAKAAEFAASCADPTGGYRAIPWDDEVDVEYTFYGLGCRGLISSSRPEAL